MSKAFDNSQIINGAPAPVDADTVDGLQASSFASTSLSNVLDTTVLTKIKNVDGAGSGLDADLLDGKDSTAFVEKINLLSEITAIDGYGSGLDADLIRGLPADFTHSIRSNGYQKLPSGLIIQWGYTEQRRVIFPIAFPNAILNAMASKGVLTNTAARSTGETEISSVLLREMYVSAYHHSKGNVIHEGLLWMAIGH